MSGMIDEFHRILRTPKRTPAQTLQQTQDLILCTMQQKFASSLDIQTIQKIFQDVLGAKAYPENNNHSPITIQEQIQLNYRLVVHFMQLCTHYFVSVDVYQALEDQTQKAQAIIRSHIKIQQQLKMYLEYLQSKINKMQRQVSNPAVFPDHLRRELQIMQSRESVMQRQKIALVKKNQKLQNQIQSLRKQLQLKRSPSISLRSSFISTSRNNLKIPQTSNTPDTNKQYPDTNKQYLIANLKTHPDSSQIRIVKYQSTKQISMVNENGFAKNKNKKKNVDLNVNVNGVCMDNGRGSASSGYSGSGFHESVSTNQGVRGNKEARLRINPEEPSFEKSKVNGSYREVFNYSA